MTGTNRPLDPVLRPFVEVRDDTQAERELAIVLEQHALPLAHAIVRRRMHSYATSVAGRSGARDREDLVADAMVSLVERLRRARADASEPPIENFASYAATVVHSVCAHDIRRRHPERARLKSRLRYIFSTDRLLASWTNGEDDAVCGLAAWRGRDVSPEAVRGIGAAVATINPRWSTLTPSGLSRAVVAVMTSAGGPVDLDTLVAAAATGIEEPRDVGDPGVAVATPATQDRAIDQQRFLARVWDEIRALPVRQRTALLLNLRDSAGRGLLWLLPIAGVATVRQIARAIETTDEDLARLWPDIPLDDAAIGLRIGCTRQQVINLRMAARKRLTNRIGGPPALAAAFSDTAANLAPISPSLKGNA